MIVDFGEYGTSSDEEDSIGDVDLQEGEDLDEQRVDEVMDEDDIQEMEEDTINVYLNGSVPSENGGTATAPPQYDHQISSEETQREAYFGVEQNEDVTDEVRMDEDIPQQSPQQMSQDGQDEHSKRRLIQSIMRDRSLDETEKRLRIQQVMDGRRVSNGLAPSSVPPIQDETLNIHNVSQDRADLNSGIQVLTEVPGCVHYERQCNIVAPCCNKVFGCRICHDEATDHGQMDRFAVREVVCKLCNTRQPSSTNNCINCNATFGEYHCGICNMWMTNSTKPFHCADCGICRVGGREAYRHCHQCCMCLATTIFDSHKCIKEKFKNNCPVCQENLFNSRQSPQDLPCGHAIHSHCFRTLASFDYRCPVCKKTIVSQSTMATAWTSRARDIEMQPMPSDLVRVVSIICNDCETRSSNRDWHFLGVQCPSCNSFNTVVEEVTSSGAEQEG